MYQGRVAGGLQYLPVKLLLILLSVLLFMGCASIPKPMCQSFYAQDLLGTRYAEVSATGDLLTYTRPSLRCP